jgi:hypothetical protein
MTAARPSRARAAVSGMDLGEKSLTFGHDSEQFAQRGSLLVVETGTQQAVVLACDFGQLGHDLAAAISEMKCVEPSIAGVALPGNVAAGFEFVDEGHHSAGQEAETSGEFLLTQTRLTIDQSQNARLRGSEVEWDEQLSERRCCAVPQLG